MLRGIKISECRERVNTTLEKVGIAHRANHLPAQLSGGQQQRVAVARAIVGDPLVLLADEPTGNLDSTNGAAVMKLLRDLHRGGATICMVTHDPHYARQADRSIRLFGGLNLESTRLTDPDRIERLLVAVTLAYLWIMEVGVFAVNSGQWRQVDNRGASRSVSLCQIGLRWLSERRNLGFLPPLFSGCFKPLEAA
jgi:energy-coupling factor transporter ATP-binding protein EcfA2